MAPIHPYKIAVPSDRLQNLHTKLSMAEFPDELDAAEWDYGVPLSEMKRLTAYWKDDFDWRKQEEKMNRLPNFMTKIQVDGFGELGVHFLHQESEVQKAVPLLFVHGWPGSYLEVEKILPLLIEGGKDGPSFHVVAPSLPNFGWSEGVKKRGFALKEYAETCHQLMLRLGYDQYVTQGGDWGAHITRTMGAMHPESVKASHLNFVIAAGPPSLTSQPLLALHHALTPHTARERAGLARTTWFLTEGYGYNKQQSTKPQTIGYALADSPTALLAWVFEKLHDWSDAYPWTPNELLTWVSLYWFAAAGPAASARIYYETMHAVDEPFAASRRGWVGGVKLGLSRFPRDLNVPPRAWGRTLGPVVFESEPGDGGHFAAHERPDELVRDLRAMFGKGGGAEGVVRGREGFV